ncbi:MAG TPA: uridine kinase [Glaciihabitans sp.]|jgi:uridine kinase|nr:uridine kinase [Glaciihabitans sp.]
MTRWAPARKDTLGALADEILHNYSRGRVLVAIDGLDGSGAAEIADDVAELIRAKGHGAFRASIKDFARPRELRYLKGADSPEGFYEDSYDYSVFRRVLVEPFRLGGSAGFVTSAFDIISDTQVEPKWLTGPDDAVLLVDGLFLNRPELAGAWNYSVWVDCAADVARERVLAEDGPTRLTNRYVGGQQLYLTKVSPRTRAVAILDNTDPNHPRRIFADSC